MSEHNESLAKAFDGQAAQFEVAPVQTDPQALLRLVGFARFVEGGRLLDTGCGPGIVSEAFLKEGFRVVGVDLSAEMIARASRRAEPFGERACFMQGSIFDPFVEGLGAFDGVISRYVLHHVVEPLAFVERQVSLLKPGGVLVLSDHTTDSDPALADRHERLERGRDITHTRNLTSDEIVKLFEAAGLVGVETLEEPFELDFDEWFDRGTPGLAKGELRTEMLEGPHPRGFEAVELADGAVRIECYRVIVRGKKSS